MKQMMHIYIRARPSLLELDNRFDLDGDVERKGVGADL
jgi:hypothetical protein|tara:strand:+ start:126 stop:239 length:114 start_codon:yes stop_codon:yes gene_type:complete